MKKKIKKKNGNERTTYNWIIRRLISHNAIVIYNLIYQAALRYNQTRSAWVVRSRVEWISELYAIATFEACVEVKFDNKSLFRCCRISYAPKGHWFVKPLPGGQATPRAENWFNSDSVIVSFNMSFSFRLLSHTRHRSLFIGFSLHFTQNNHESNNMPRKPVISSSWNQVRSLIFFYIIIFAMLHVPFHFRSAKLIK